MARASSSDPPSKKLGAGNAKSRLREMLAQKGLVKQDLGAIPRRPRSGPCALSTSQERLFFLQELLGAVPAYNSPFALRVTGTLELAGLESPSRLEGRSFLPALLQGKATRTHIFSEAEGTIFEKPRPWEMVSDGRFKLVEFGDGSDPHLYDVETDPGELTNLFGTHENHERVVDLRGALARWRLATR